jgi:hypothetical protein|tara:strand:+ start:925 stop:1197 length:273 start_codon:yes stop_codon:yes gene_type:complete
MKTFNKKGQMSLGQVPNAVQLLVIIGIFLAVGAMILEGVKDQTTTGSNAYNTTEDAEGGLGTLGDFQGLIALVVAAAVILGLVALIGFRS